MSKAYDRTENGITTRISLREGLEEINSAMMDRVTTRGKVRSMSSISRNDYAITYKDDRKVTLVQVTVKDEPGDAAEWSGTASRPFHVHKIANNRARCSSRIWPKSWQGVGVILHTRKEIEAGESARLYTFCPRCEAL